MSNETKENEMAAPQEGNEVRMKNGTIVVIEDVVDYGHDTHMKYIVCDGLAIYARPQDLEVLS